MKQLTAQDKELSDRLFSDFYYRNEHLGWFTALDLPARGLGKTCLLEHDGKQFLAAFQEIAPRKQWLHSFFQEGDTEPFSFREFPEYRELFSRQTIYSISSHIWYTRLLKFNGFMQCDAVIQMETELLRLPKETASGIEIKSFDLDLADRLLESCETAFPPIWRLCPTEFTFEVEQAPVRLAAFLNGAPAGFVTADIAEGNCHILRLAVSPEHQGEGIATALLTKLFLDCVRQDGIDTFSVNTNQKNAPAVSLYEKFGLEIRGKRFPVFTKQFI